MFVASLITSTEACGIAAPDVSRTWPFTTAVGACARERSDEHKKMKPSTPMRCLTLTSLSILSGAGIHSIYGATRTKEPTSHSNILRNKYLLRGFGRKKAKETRLTKGD